VFFREASRLASLGLLRIRALSSVICCIFDFKLFSILVFQSYNHVDELYWQLWFLRHNDWMASIININNKMSQETLNGINSIVDDVKGFSKDSMRFLNKCSKPDRKGTTPFAIP
jgi:hypothetical protein